MELPEGSKERTVSVNQSVRTVAVRNTLKMTVTNPRCRSTRDHATNAESQDTWQGRANQGGRALQDVWKTISKMGEQTTISDV